MDEKPLTFMDIIMKLNHPKMLVNDSLLIIFESLLIHKIRNYLSPQSLFSFDSILRHSLPANKFSRIYNKSKGYTTHLPRARE